MVREGSSSFIAQRCSDAHGRYMQLVENGGGSRCSFIFIPEEMEGKGWRRMAEALWEFASEGRGISHNRGGAPMRPSVAMLQLQKHSYREVLESIMKLVQPRERNRRGDSGAMEAQKRLCDKVTGMGLAELLLPQVQLVPSWRVAVVGLLLA